MPSRVIDCARTQTRRLRSNESHRNACSFQSAKLLAVPWRAYGEIDDAALRDAILDFFEDIARGEKQLAARTAPRVKTTVAALTRKETDPVRLARIKAMVEILTAAEEASAR